MTRVPCSGCRTRRRAGKGQGGRLITRAARRAFGCVPPEFIPTCHSDPPDDHVLRCRTPRRHGGTARGGHRDRCTSHCGRRHGGATGCSNGCSTSSRDGGSTSNGYSSDCCTSNSGARDGGNRGTARSGHRCSSWCCGRDRCTPCCRRGDYGHRCPCDNCCSGLHVHSCDDSDGGSPRINVWPHSGGGSPRINV